MNDGALKESSKANTFLNVPNFSLRNSLVEGLTSPMKNLSRCNTFSGSRFCHTKCSKCNHEDENCPLIP